MLPVNPWPVSDNKFALLQTTGGNPEIVKKMGNMDKKVLNVDPVINSKSTFTCHHMILNQVHLESFKNKYKSTINRMRTGLNY